MFGRIAGRGSAHSLVSRMSGRRMPGPGLAGRGSAHSLVSYRDLRKSMWKMVKGNYLFKTEVSGGVIHARKRLHSYETSKQLLQSGSQSEIASANQEVATILSENSLESIDEIIHLLELRIAELEFRVLMWGVLDSAEMALPTRRDRDDGNDGSGPTGIGGGGGIAV
jgi:hypothetical protein